MKLYLGVNSDRTEIISKIPLKRYVSYEKNKYDALSYEDTEKPPHWIPNYEGKCIARMGHAPIDEYLTLPSGSILKIFGRDMTWDNECESVEL